MCEPCVPAKTAPSCFSDFMYNQTSYSTTYTINGTRIDIKLPGAVHTGITRMLDTVLGPVMRFVLREVAMGRVNSVQVAGHSIGGGVGMPLSYILQRALQLDPRTSSRSIVVDAALYGGPRAGDEAFTRSFDTIVNARRIMFEYDVVQQVPCSPIMPACKDVLVPTNKPRPEVNGTAWPYATPNGLIEFVARKMPAQPESWSELRVVEMNTIDKFVTTTHTCSYLCYFAQFTGDPHDNCLLWESAPPMAPASGAYCDGLPSSPPFP